MNTVALPALQPASSDSESPSIHFSVQNSIESDVDHILVHSHHSIINGEPSKVDNRKSARQRRKRTSPEDQATLETEYMRNPKPDKAARVEILKKVSLREKEIQIWFQNRRQNTRRKTRPLLPHEIAAFGLGGMATLSSAPVFGIANGVSESTILPALIHTKETQNKSQELCHSIGNSQEVQHVLTSPDGVQISGSPETSTSSVKSSNMLPEPHSRSYTHFSGPHDMSPPNHSSENLPASLGYQSTQRHYRASSPSTPSSPSLPILRASSISKQSPSYSEIISASKAHPPLSSQVRLSLSLDGKAELVSSQISPPRTRHARASSFTSTANQNRPGLKRSQSDIPSSYEPRKSSGRSCNVRTWEFCCDTDARDELTTQAENESSGSAIAAISLLRSTSTSHLKSNGSKRDVPPPKTESIIQGKKPKLSRASNLARLQSSHKAQLGSPSGDSDKENWLPHEGLSNSHRPNLALPRPQKQKRRRVLKESTIGLTHASMPVGHKMHGNPASTTLDYFRDPMPEPEVDREVGRFMRGEVSPSKKGDLDCIQGLLSLSQGSWR